MDVSNNHIIDCILDTHHLSHSADMYAVMNVLFVNECKRTDKYKPDLLMGSKC